MRNLWKNVLVLWVIFVGLGVSAPASAQTTANGPYYATPSWDQTLPSNTRYIVLSNMNSEAFLDRETGVVWSRTPVKTGVNGLEAASEACANAIVGNRMGWRLPAISELTSLTSGKGSDGTVVFMTINEAMDPSYPTGFVYVWSGTSYVDSLSGRRTWSLFRWNYSLSPNGRVWQPVINAASSMDVWCVRSPSSGDNF